MTASLAEILRRERASVFFHAPWSGPSVLALRLLRERLSARVIPEDEVCVIDVDVEEDAISRLVDGGIALHGYGEVVVIRNGAFRYFSALGRGSEPTVTRIDAFLDEHRG